MSSYFDDASLVMIPSGYKTSKVYSVKPTDGSGDLTFSRSNDTATRVNSAGLIEKVRTNLNLYSQDFTNAHYGKANITVTANSVANPLDGVVNADTIVASAGTTQKYIGPNTALNGLYNYSVYVKYVSHQFVQLFLGLDASQYVNFDIQNGVASASGAATASIVSVGSGWYRLSMSFSTVTGIGIYLLNVDSLAAARFVATSSTGSYYAFGAQLEAGDIATSYIATTSAAVSVGPVANVPRLDYLNSSCPRLLLEPQRTNLVTYSEQFDNAAWTKSLCTISANASTSPDGYSNSDRITASAGTGIAQMYSAFSASAGAYTYSFFVKAGTHSQVFFGSYGTAAFGGAFTYRDMIFDIATGTITASAGNLSVSSQINNYGNGWYRVAITYSATANGTVTYILGLAKDTTTISGTWAGTENILGYGIQVEAGAYATSYIPTLGAAVTRGADAASKTGISSLIGQTEGTLFIDVVPSDLSSLARYISIEAAAGVGSGWIGIFASGTNTFRFYGDGFDFNAGAQVRGTRYKVAMAYKNGVLTSAYINGTSVGTLTANTTGKSYANLKLANATIGNLGCSDFFQSIIFPTALSNAQLAELTA